MAAEPGSPDGERGFASTSFLAAVALSLVAVVAVVNLLVFAYARGALRAALDEGVRAGTRAADAAGECERRATAALDDLLAGQLRAAVGDVTCRDDGDRVAASVTGRLPAWAPGIPDWPVRETAVASRERQP